MLTRCLRAVAAPSYFAPSMMRSFATAKKDYYDILGLNKDASVDEIKTAYRNLAKRYHPDVNASTEAYEGDADRFKDVVEAYQVLSVSESRTAYDLHNQSAPDFIYRAQRMETMRKYSNRGKDGNPIKAEHPSGSYAEKKRQFLADERKKFNVNAFGRYNGGVPQRDKGNMRGTSLGAPGSFHDPAIHNQKINPHPDSQFVTSADALAFKNYMMEDKYALKRRNTWFQAKIDYDFFKFETYALGWRWIRNILLFTFGLGAVLGVVARAQNRSVLKQVEKLREAGKWTNGTQINGRKVVQGSTGIIKYA